MGIGVGIRNGGDNEEACYESGGGVDVVNTVYI